MTPQDTPKPEAVSGGLDSIRRMIRWGDYQRENGNWGYGVANWEEVEAVLQAHIEKEVARAVTKANKSRLIWLDEKVAGTLANYAEDVFTPASKEDYERMNKMDASLNTRLHCSGIRHGLHQLRRVARGLSAREDLEVIRIPALTKDKNGAQE